MDNRIIEIIISCFAVYGFLTLIYDFKKWCIKSINRKIKKNIKK